jgi:hypothetical protein
VYFRIGERRVLAGLTFFCAWMSMATSSMKCFAALMG